MLKYMRTFKVSFPSRGSIQSDLNTPDPFREIISSR